MVVWSRRKESKRTAHQAQSISRERSSRTVFRDFSSGERKGARCLRASVRRAMSMNGSVTTACQLKRLPSWKRRTRVSPCPLDAGRA